jgi:hypothetical protein
VIGPDPRWAGSTSSSSSRSTAFFAGPAGELDWLNGFAKDDEYEKYTHAQVQGGGSLIFGRTTLK